MHASYMICLDYSHTGINSAYIFLFPYHIAPPEAGEQFELALLGFTMMATKDVDARKSTTGNFFTWTYRKHLLRAQATMKHCAS